MHCSTSSSGWGNVRCANGNSFASTTAQLDVVGVRVGALGDLHWLALWFLCSSFSLSEVDLFVDRDLSVNCECSVCSLNSEGSVCSLSALTAVGLAELREWGVWHLGFEESCWYLLLGLECVCGSLAKAGDVGVDGAWTVEGANTNVWGTADWDFAVVIPVTIIITVFNISLDLSKCFSSHLSQAILESGLRCSSDATSEEGD